MYTCIGSLIISAKSWLGRSANPLMTDQGESFVSHPIPLKRDYHHIYFHYPPGLRTWGILCR